MLDCDIQDHRIDFDRYEMRFRKDNVKQAVERSGSKADAQNLPGVLVKINRDKQSVAIGYDLPGRIFKVDTRNRRAVFHSSKADEAVVPFDYHMVVW
jgi:hypothetical protein